MKISAQMCLKWDITDPQTSTSKDFLKKVNPSIAVISVGKDNIYNHPDAITTKLLDESNIKTYRTDKDGTIVICSDGSNISKK